MLQVATDFRAAFQSDHRPTHDLSHSVVATSATMQHDNERPHASRYLMESRIEVPGAWLC